MSIESNIFKRFKPDFNKLVKFGFKNIGNKYIFEKTFLNNQFRSKIEVDNEGVVSGTVFDVENNEEFLPLRIKNPQGAFVGEVKSAYEKFLHEICDKCFIKKYYIYPQSNRISELIIKKYGNEPEFLWKTYPGSGIFRNPESKKWYAAILDTDRSRLQKNKDEFIEVINLKLKPDYVKEITSFPHFYPAYHMNKKMWISIILDETVSDEKIMELVEESHKLTAKK